MRDDLSGSILHSGLIPERTTNGSIPINYKIGTVAIAEFA